ncbi:MAG: hypothetical protein A3E01_09975 [Gammaproteobacteria bacterium RIFCSPHIGHO2_12_FULL_63_22]|nr:MAG: hypothetical protein A3E01_09975 [Gammaproteobacteria bacterium RIFCSPHIGHO2_12_FULL_63_22]
MTREDQMLFALAPTSDGQPPIIIFAISQAAWEYMKDGKTHTFDLTKSGIPLRLMCFGAKSHSDAMKTLNDAMAKLGVPYLDERSKDFSI